MRISQLAATVYALEPQVHHAGLNSELLSAYTLHASDETLRRSHFFGGRYENVYIGADKIPALDAVLKLARHAACEVLALDTPADELQAGCWFNAMAPGQATQPHVHDDYDEILSAVYYVRVPENSGDLILHLAGGPLRIAPCVGRMILFPPDVLHEVAANQSAQTRLSIGINIGPPPAA